MSRSQQAPTRVAFQLKSIMLRRLCFKLSDVFPLRVLHTSVSISYIRGYSALFKYSELDIQTVGTKVKVVMIGNSLRISIPKPLAESLGIKEGDEVELSVVGSRVRIELSRA